jgi:hypothetical protein
MRDAGHIACMVEVKNTYKTSVGKSESKRLLERPRCGCEDTIKMDLKVAGCENVDRIQLAQDIVHCWVLVIAVKNLWVL